MKKRNAKNEGTYTKQTLNERNVKALKDMCSERGLSTKGTKAELMERLLANMEKETAKISEAAKTTAETSTQPSGKPPSLKKGRSGTKGPRTKARSLCSLCSAQLTGDEAKCPGCGVTFGDEVFVLFDSDWNVYREIPTASEIVKMGKEDLLRIAQILNLEQDLDEQDLREILLEVIQEMENERCEDETKELSVDMASDPKKALEEINYLRDELKKHAQALTLYDRMLVAIAKSKDTGLLKQVLIHKGICLQGMREFKRAVATFDLALELDPKSAEVTTLVMGARSLQKAFEDQHKGPGGERGPDPAHIKPIPPQEGRRVVDMGFKPMFGSPQEASSPVLLTPMSQSTSPKPVPEPVVKACPAQKDDQKLMSEVERMSERLERLKGLRARVDVGDIESKCKNGSGVTLSTVDAGRQEEPEPSMPQAPKPSDALTFVPTPKTAQRPRQPLTASKDPEPSQARPSEPWSAVEEAPMPRVTIGSESLDAILGGGIMAGQNVLVRSPPLAGRDLMFHKCVASNLKGGMGAVIVTASEPIVVLRGKIGDLYEKFLDMEAKGSVLWIDPRSRQMKDRYPAHEGLEPDHALILSALKEHLDALEKAGLPAGVFIASLTPMTSYRDPHVIQTFLKDITRLVGKRAKAGIFCIESDMHDEAELRMLEEHMDAVLELKERPPSDRMGGGLLLQVKRMPGIEPTRWLPFKHDDSGFTVGQ